MGGGDRLFVSNDGLLGAAKGKTGGENEISRLNAYCVPASLVRLITRRNDDSPRVYKEKLSRVARLKLRKSSRRRGRCTNLNVGGSSFTNNIDVICGRIHSVGNSFDFSYRPDARHSQCAGIITFRSNYITVTVRQSAIPDRQLAD